MNQLIERYKALNGHEPSQKTVANLSRIAQVLDLRENDALWSVLIALEYYDERYRAAPRRIENTVQAVMKSIQTTANHETKTAAARSIEAMAQESGRIAREIATEVSGRDRKKWLSITISVCALALISTGAGAFYAGHKTGSAATTEAALWATTDIGRKAREMSEAGMINMIYDCSGEGWRIKEQGGGRVCYPDLGGGWTMPWK